MIVMARVLAYICCENNKNQKLKQATTDANQIEEKVRKISDQLSNIIFTQRGEDKRNLFKENLKKK